MLLVAFLFCTVIASSAQSTFFTSLASFDGTDGSYSYAGLVESTDGNFYGTAWAGGTYNDGTVFKVTPNGTLTTLHSFDGQDGRGPYSLVHATDGNFYGTTVWGGAYGAGTIFKITPSGTLTTLFSFDGQDGSAGAVLLQARDGNFYGITAGGGTNGGYGTVYRITPGGILSTLYSFDGTDGQGPDALMQASDGNFYGATGGGGTNGGYGTIFKITPSGLLTTLHSFDNSQGWFPTAGLMQASDGSFYGTTNYGSNNNCSTGCGTVFKITPSGTLTTLHSFDGSDGAYPVAGVVQDRQGNLYGATYGGGAYNNCSYGCGTVFMIAPSGTLTTLHSFDGTDGDSPLGALVQATDGNFYGTTPAGGRYGDGTVFGVGFVGPCARCSP
jgi:uncharacterized repeat protein (TIGR03803 family)